MVLINASLAEALDRHRAATPHAQPTDWICAHVDVQAAFRRQTPMSTSVRDVIQSVAV